MVIAREDLRDDPLLGTYAMEHCLDPVELSSSIFIKDYVNMSITSGQTK